LPENPAQRRVFLWLTNKAIFLYNKNMLNYSKLALLQKNNTQKWGIFAQVDQK